MRFCRGRANSGINFTYESITALSPHHANHNHVKIEVFQLQNKEKFFILVSDIGLLVEVI